ncbi:BZ3500_MvSof-1268-A1-R1_Chr11-3g03599 [Microbotryum saponariae]|uniref:BZ3500_MvSof-1268-A1-R1_Chr11-3g03599 protein n=1 Tax=Microbotryum saponariae TaxID=289078 RepID=A0A2X0LFA1_9BASI|nr:BZ3500_MvSof-1268-A1-R1_Chr11-3g03599 [Microbotryum saponariae]SDA03608.1 BZ3501_MvSof-1269-A2-R1_Chr11g03176 [Microbotryum saponariae]
MAPAARLTLPAGTRLPTFHIAPPHFRVQGWDPLLIIAQIVTLQTLHYLTLALLLPPLLSRFASSTLLGYEGGPSSVSVVMDWREFIGRPTTSLPTRRSLPAGLVGLDVFQAVSTSGAWGLKTLIAKGDGKAVHVGVKEIEEGLVRVLEYDQFRGWVVAIAWCITAMIDVFYLYHFVRRPTHILDSSLTLLFNHLILTTYYSSQFPTSFFFYFILIGSSVAQIVLAEQMCVRREMKEGFSFDENGSNSSASPDVNMNGGGGRLGNSISGGSNGKGSTDAVTTPLLRNNLSPNPSEPLRRTSSPNPITKHSDEQHEMSVFSSPSSITPQSHSHTKSFGAGVGTSTGKKSHSKHLSLTTAVQSVLGAGSGGGGGMVSSPISMKGG